MVSRQETTSNREAVSSLSRPTDARSSALTKQDGSAPNKTNNREGLGQILEFFETFITDMKAKFASRGSANDPMIPQLESVIGQMRETFELITGTLQDYDKKLIGVLGQHQDDFWYAFKTHMNKIETELQFLQQKSKEQDTKLTQDARIIGLEEQLKWYQNEFQNLMKVKSQNDEQIKHLKDQCKNLVEGSEELKVNVKAAKRQNKLLGAAFQKAQTHKTELEELQGEIALQTASIRRETVLMPNLVFSPFLPLSQQLEQQKQLELMSVASLGASGLQDLQYFHEGNFNETFQRLNSDLPFQQQQYQETEAAPAQMYHQESDRIEVNGGNHQPQQTVQLNVDGSFDNANEGSASKAMESIPEEDASKANLHSSHSKAETRKDLKSRISVAADQTFEQCATQFYNRQTAQPIVQESTVLQQYVKDLVAAGKSELEMMDDIERYYDTLVKSCDNEILDLKEELEYEKAAHREQAADEVYLKANENDELSNIFIECIHAHRKSLRQQLVKMKFKEVQGQEDGDNGHFDQSRSSQMGGLKNKKTNLLQTYLRIVKTGAPEEIERFSQIERQKLVELLVTNQELLNFMFDKMFKNNYDPKEREQMLLSKMTLSETAFDPGSLEQLYQDDPLELLQRSTELRRAHEQSQTATKYHRMLKPVGSTGQSKTDGTMMPQLYSQTKTQTQGYYRGNNDQILNMKLMLDRKQRSMAIGVGRSETIDEMTASPLLLQQNAKGERQTLRGYDSLNEAQQQLYGSFKQAHKVGSDFGKNVFHHLSKVDTDKMQTQFLSNKEVEPAKPSQKSIVLPTIIQRPGAERSSSEAHSPREARTVHSSNAQLRGTAPSGRTQAQNAQITGRSKKSLLTGRSQRQIRAMSNRPLIHIRDGKLLLSGPQHKR